MCVVTERNAVFVASVDIKKQKLRKSNYLHTLYYVPNTKYMKEFRVNHCL